MHGQRKLEGELSVSNILDKYFIVCISWGGGKNGKSFNKIMLNIEKKFSTIRVVNDQTDIPIYILDLSVLLVNMAEKEQ